MKLDITKLPVIELVVGFFILVLAVTFVGAFGYTRDSPLGAAAPASATPAASPSPGGSATPVPSGGGGPLAVTQHDNSFDPKELTVKAGSAVIISITNSGSATHNMHIAGEGGNFNDSSCSKTGKDPCSDPNIIPGGKTATLSWQAPDAAGKVNFRCDFHPQEMTGTITVQ